MSRYDGLAAFLKSQHVERIPMTFADIERITNAKLPPSAHKHRPWWSNNPDNSVMTRVWLEAGFKSEQVDMAGQKLVFRRVVGAKSAAAPVGEAPKSIHPAYGALKGMVRIMPGTDLTAPADPGLADWIDEKY
jgi:hypothetical protein